MIKTLKIHVAGEVNDATQVSVLIKQKGKPTEELKILDSYKDSDYNVNIRAHDLTSSPPDS